MTKPVECRECRKLFMPERDSREQPYCSRHCSRVAQARAGLPSFEDKKLLIASMVCKAIDEMFKPKK